jgi:hypothetical protein
VAVTAKPRGEIVRDEGLQEGLVHLRPALAAGRIGETPEVVREDAEGPRAALLHQDSGGAGGPLAGLERRPGRGRPEDHRPDTPGQAGHARARREEEALGDVAEAGLVLRRVAFLVHERDDGAGDQRPVVGQPEGDHRLDVQRPTESVVARATAEVEVVLERHADQVGDRVLQLLRQLGIAAKRV